ncbi:HD-GYP domain-containing protein [Vibrio sp. SCSIO 43137]|uniref:HD-GYP domain-containing protein n=1 Tax=Vibrio sp. SCSIO 43137 TaxID=3021011 RepID=UPI0023073CFC|nr:HD domain-containing phosphohydrolase [Vibrio sp. SCSIO 43137]WCE28336.1 HD domain-containing protein [Vibrio sp. SCSIO 43137]
MYKAKYQEKNTFLSYVVAAIVYGTYGSRVCPFLDTLTTKEIFLQVSFVFALLFITRLTLAKRGIPDYKGSIAKLDTLLFFSFSLPFSLFYNLVYDFGVDSHFKVVFGMTLFGFLTGTILELLDKERYLQSDKLPVSLSGERRSIIKQMIGLFTTLIVALTVSMVMIEIKDIYWLEHNIDKLADGSGKLSVIKEFIYVSAVLFAYAFYIIRLWTRLLKAVLNSQESALAAVSAGDAQTRVPVFDHDELGSVASLTNSMLDSLEVSHQEVQTTRDVAIVSLAALAESRDNETGAHILRTQQYVKSLAEFMSQKPQHTELLTPAYIDLLYKSAPLHDVGKVGIPDSVLLKPGKLTDEEFETMKGHPQIGADALATAEQQLGSSSFLNVAKEISLTHHEKWDGSGYPNKLSGTDIPLSGRLMALADVYDALISKRVYKPAFSHEKAKAIILEGSGSHFDPEVVEAFVAIEDEFVRIAATFKDNE